MEQEIEPVMISAIQHYSYCPRQCALIHVERTFDENIYTLRGKAAHERVDEPSGRTDDGMRIERALPLWSARLGLIGKSDVVEFHGCTPYPVEYKHGPRRPQVHDDLQLCAQALCLEEMFGEPVPAGAIYHHSSHRRRDVVCDVGLRDKVIEIIAKIRDMLAEPHLPPPANDARCENCSLRDSCLPVVTERDRLRKVRQMLFEVGGE